MVVIIASLPNGGVVVYGPFDDKDKACYWARETFDGPDKPKQDWYWEYVFKPSPANIYLTTMHQY